MTDVIEILVHWYAGRSQSEVAASLGVDRKTIKKYLNPAMVVGIVPGGPVMTTADWAELIGKWFPQVTDTMFVRPVLVMDQRAWTECHVAAFDFFAGVPARLVPDNLKTGVDKPDLYDPKINRPYAEWAEYYGTLIDPARAAKPKDKPRVERPMPYVRDSFWWGREFVSLQHMHEQAVLWCTEVAGRRQCRPLGGAAPAAVFAAVEAGELKPLPRKRFVLAVWSTGTIGPDIHVGVGKTLYSVPWRHIGRRVDARATPTVVQIFDNGELIATHGRRPVGKSTDLSHDPPEKIAFKMRTPTWCRTKAADIGPACAELIGGLLQVNALFGLRAAQGVLGLAGKHGPIRLEKACARASEVGDPSYRTVKGILAAGTEADPAPEPTGDAGAAAHLHGPSQLFANVVALPTPTTPPTLDQATPSADHQPDTHDECGDHRAPVPTEPATDNEEAS